MKKLCIAVGLGSLAAAVPALAQSSVQRFERQLEQIQRENRLRANPDVPAGQRALFDYGAYLNTNFYAIDDIEQSTHILRQYELVGFGRLNIDGVHEFFLRARTEYRDFNSGDSFDDDGDEMTWPTIDQAYYRFDLARYLSAYKGKSTPNNLVIQAGRQFVYWANGLVLAEYMDGGLVDFTLGGTTLQLLGGSTIHDTVDFDPSRPDFDKRTERGFFGGILSSQFGRHRPFVYGLVQRDWNEDDPFTTGIITTEYEYNSYYIGAGVNGSLSDRLVYGLEVVYEGGEGLSNSFDPDTLAPVEQTEEDITAGALDLRLDYLVGDPRRTRLSLETVLATGDPDRTGTSSTFGGNAPGTSDRAFNAWGLVNTGLAFAPSVSNLIAVRGGVSAFPFPNGGLFRRFQAGVDVFVFGKFLEDAPINETTTDDRFLGWEPDLYINWQLTSDLSLALRYGVFFPGTAIVEDDHPRNFFFAGLTLAF